MSKKSFAAQSDNDYIVDKSKDRPHQLEVSKTTRRVGATQANNEFLSMYADNNSATEQVINRFVQPINEQLSAESSHTSRPTGSIRNYPKDTMSENIALNRQMTKSKQRTASSNHHVGHREEMMSNEAARESEHTQTCEVSKVVAVCDTSKSVSSFSIHFDRLLTDFKGNLANEYKRMRDDGYLQSYLVNMRDN
jgi:hypothetical protein